MRGQPQGLPLRLGPLCPSDISPAERGQPGPPLRKAKGTRAKHAGDARDSPQQPHIHKTILSHNNATVAKNARIHYNRPLSRSAGEG